MMHPDRRRTCLKVPICFKHPEFLIGRQGVVIIYLAFGLSSPYPHPHRCLSNIGDYTFESQSLQTHKPHRWHTKIHSDVRLEEISVLLDLPYSKRNVLRKEVAFVSITAILYYIGVQLCLVDLWGCIWTHLPLKLIRGLKIDHKYMCRWYDHMNKTKCSSLTLENGSKLMKSTWNSEGTAS